MDQKELFELFKKWNPGMARMIVNYKQWGHSSICLWLRNGMLYKAKYYPVNKFVMQTLTKEDVERKYGGLLNEDN